MQHRTEEDADIKYTQGQTQDQTTGGSTAQIWTLEAKEAKLNMTHTGQETIKIKEEVTDTGHD